MRPASEVRYETRSASRPVPPRREPRDLDLPPNYREIDERPFESAPRPIRGSRYRHDLFHDFENVTFENDPYLAPSWTKPAEVHPRHTPAPVTPPPVEEVDRIATVLAPATPIEVCETVEADVASRLRAIGIVTVGDFVNADTASMDSQLQSWGLGTRPIRRWQDQLVLRCEIVGVSADDARLIVACGITSTESLANADSESLAEQIGRLLSTSRDRTGTHYASLRNSYSRQRIGRWIEAARAADRWKRGRGYHHGASSSHSPTAERPVANELASSFDDEYEVDYREPRSPHSSRSSRSSARSGNSRQARNGARSDDQEQTSRSRSTRSRSSNRRSTSSRSSQSGDSLRFYLDRQDPVVDAPTIGPRTAERLHQAGIRTVADLLDADAETLAARIDYHRISADDIREWQQQSALACCVPQLRGHDAQILVACGITTPTKLAACSAEVLWETIEPFTRTSECKRIVRNGRAPDLAEVTDWIAWAQSARSLQIA